MTHTEAFAEFVRAARAHRAETAATRVTWRRVASDTGGGWSGLGPDGALAFVAPSSGRSLTGTPVIAWGVVRGTERIVIGTAPSASLAKSQAAAFLVANGPTAADEAVKRPEEGKMPSKTRTKKSSPKSDEARAQRETKARQRAADADAALPKGAHAAAETAPPGRRKAQEPTPAPAEAPASPDAPKGESGAEGAPETVVHDLATTADGSTRATRQRIPGDKVEKLDPPSAAERAEAATGQKRDGAEIAEVLLRTIRERIPGATLEASKGGGKRYVRVGGKTLGYVTLGKRHPSVIVGRSAPVAVKSAEEIAEPVEALAATSQS